MDDDRKLTEEELRDVSLAALRWLESQGIHPYKAVPILAYTIGVLVSDLHGDRRNELIKIATKMIKTVSTLASSLDGHNDQR